jgi:hypothetical protein
MKNSTKEFHQIKKINQILCKIIQYQLILETYNKINYRVVFVENHYLDKKVLKKMNKTYINYNNQ